MSVLAIDVGSTSVRVVVYGDDGTRLDAGVAPLTVRSPTSGAVEYDADEIADTAISLATELCVTHSPAVVGIANQRGSTVMWDSSDGAPVGPVIGWQDSRTVDRCAELAAEGLVAFPNQLPAKAEWLWNDVDPARSRDLRIGTIDSWLTWNLTRGEVHVSDTSNMATAGILGFDGETPAEEMFDTLSIPRTSLPGLAPTSGMIATAAALPNQPPITALVGDQQASLAGHGCHGPGQAKLTFGSGMSLNAVVADDAVLTGVSGCFPIVAWTRDDLVTRGFEAIDLSAGSTLEWACELGLFDDTSALVSAAESCSGSDGVVVVPTLSGMGTPSWRLDACGAVYGLTRGSSRDDLAHALLRGLTFRAAELVDAATEEIGGALTGHLRIDGGLTRSATFTQWVADAVGAPVEVAVDPEVTVRGAAMLAAAGATGQGRVPLPMEFACEHRLIEPGETPDRRPWTDAVRRTLD